MLDRLPKRSQNGAGVIRNIDCSTIVEQFRSCAVVGPEAPAVITVSDGSKLTYGELELRSNQLAHHLRKLKVGSGSIVGIFLERTTDLIVAMLAVLKAGGAYLPLDAEYPSGRIELMLDIADTQVLIAQKSLESRLTSYSGKKVLIDSDWPEVSHESVSPLDNEEISRGAPAYVLFTSGSTGEPKGVMVSYAALLNFIRSMQRVLKRSSGDTFAATASTSFDISIFEIFLPLAIGATIALFDRKSVRDGPLFAKLVSENGVTMAQATPTGWKMLLEADYKNENLTVLTGGEVLPRDVAKALTTNFKAAWTGYGPTETTVYSSIERLRKERKVYIGKPILDTKYYILNDALDLVPPGEVGELHIAGACLAIGYLNRPGLTADRFIADPFANGGGRMYRTGDLVRSDKHQNIEYVGRVDRQVKLRGYRIELEEIEATLLRHPAVFQAAVNLQEDDTGEKYLAAYVAFQKGSTLDLRELKDFLEELLPQHMIPSKYFVLESFPLTSNGKLDRKTLAKVEQVPLTLERQGMPEDDIERALATIWQEMLKLDNVGISDHFLDLGGHSLTAMRITARVSAAFDVHLSMALIFSYPTVQLYAEALRKKLAQESAE